MARRPGGLIEEELTRSVIGAFFDVYNTLGYGFLEHVYALALERELLGRGHRVGREVSVNIAYKGITLTSQRLDFVVDERLIVEAKSTQNLPAFAARQLLSPSDEPYDWPPAPFRPRAKVPPPDLPQGSAPLVHDPFDPSDPAYPTSKTRRTCGSHQLTATLPGL